jgi:hypothetical protein
MRGARRWRRLDTLVSTLERLEPPMDSNGLRAATLIGVAAAAGAFGAAALMSAATAPTARADAYSDIVADVEADLTYGQTAFGQAAVM